MRRAGVRLAPPLLTLPLHVLVTAQLPARAVSPMAQERGEVQTRGGDRVSNVPDRNNAPTTDDIGLSRKQIHEARRMVNGEPGRQLGHHDDAVTLAALARERHQPELHRAPAWRLHDRCRGDGCSARATQGPSRGRWRHGSAQNLTPPPRIAGAFLWSGFGESAYGAPTATRKRKSPLAFA